MHKPNFKSHKCIYVSTQTKERCHKRRCMKNFLKFFRANIKLRSELTDDIKPKISGRSLSGD